LKFENKNNIDIGFKLVLFQEFSFSYRIESY
jgi:hypothetical protein